MRRSHPFIRFDIRWSLPTQERPARVLPPACPLDKRQGRLASGQGRNQNDHRDTEM